MGRSGFGKDYLVKRQERASQLKIKVGLNKEEVEY
jgi:hypothetical protein